MTRIILFAFLTVITTSAAEKAVMSTDKKTNTAYVESGKEQALAIEQTYEDFINTKPSPKKRALALQTKEEIETFEASYPDSQLIPSLRILLEEVDFYLNP